MYLSDKELEILHRELYAIIEANSDIGDPREDLDLMVKLQDKVRMEKARRKAKRQARQASNGITYSMIFNSIVNKG